MIIGMRIRLQFNKVRKFILGFLLFATVFSGGYYLGIAGYRAQLTKSLEVNLVRLTPADKNADMSLFWQVWDTLSAKYYDKSKLLPSEMVYGAIGGMVSSLGDPYTMYLPPDQNKIVNEDLSGSFQGVGIEIGYKNTHLAVISPLQGSPAEKAGIKAGDYIIHIKDDKKGINIDSSNLPISQAVNYIRGPAGTTVELTILRDGTEKAIVVPLVRAKLDVPSVTLAWAGKEGNVANIKISKFDSQTAGEWDKIVRQVTDKCQTGGSSCKGIVVDLRNNPGGYMQSAVDVGSDFVQMGTVIVIQQNGDGSREEYKSSKLPRLSAYKVVVLINGGSASASEILAGALRDDRGIKLVGDKSFGKGTIQEPIDIKGGSGIHITTAKWLTPNGTWVHEKGLTPDVSISLKDDFTEDLQLNAALDLFK